MSFENIINMIAKVSDETIVISPNDYKNDGLIYCGKCNTPKQYRLSSSVMNLNKLVKCLCKCESEELEIQKINNERLKRAEYLQKIKLDPLQEENLKVDFFVNDKGYCKKQMDLILKYLSKFHRPVKENKGLLFYGNVGSGKTFLTGCIANWLFDNDFTVMYTSLNKIIKSLQGFDILDKNAHINRICNYDCLILEDFGTERNTEFASEIIFDIINTRYLNKKPLIINTNIPIADFDKPKNIEEKRIYDRILEMCVPIKFENIEIRKKLARDSYNDFLKEMEI